MQRGRWSMRSTASKSVWSSQAVQAAVWGKHSSMNETDQLENIYCLLVWWRKWTGWTHGVNHNESSVASLFNRDAPLDHVLVQTCFITLHHFMRPRWFHSAFANTSTVKASVMWGLPLKAPLSNYQRLGWKISPSSLSKPSLQLGARPGPFMEKVHGGTAVVFLWLLWPSWSRSVLTAAPFTSGLAE